MPHYHLWLLLRLNHVWMMGVKIPHGTVHMLHVMNDPSQILNLMVCLSEVLSCKQSRMDPKNHLKASISILLSVYEFSTCQGVLSYII